MMGSVLRQWGLLSLLCVITDFYSRSLEGV